MSRFLSSISAEPSERNARTSWAWPGLSGRAAAWKRLSIGSVRRRTPLNLNAYTASEPPLGNDLKDFVRDATFFVLKRTDRCVDRVDDAGPWRQPSASVSRVFSPERLFNPRSARSQSRERSSAPLPKNPFCWSRRSRRQLLSVKCVRTHRPSPAYYRVSVRPCRQAAMLSASAPVCDAAAMRPNSDGRL